MELLKSSSGPFELDPCFEFDAPKFCDLSKIRDDAEDCHQHVDSWFDAKGGNGEAQRSRVWLRSLAWLHLLALLLSVGCRPLLPYQDSGPCLRRTRGLGPQQCLAKCI